MNEEINLCLTSCQRRVFDKIKKGGNVFITGNAGTGKSTLIKEIIKWFEKNNKNCGITSSTGTSALQFNGSTIHSYLGIGIAEDFPLAMVMKTLRKKPNKAKNIYMLDVLFLDEISMISNIVLDKIAEYIFLIQCYFDFFYDKDLDDGTHLPNLDDFYAKYFKHKIPLEECLKIKRTQLIFCGDFRQLPPVQDKHKKFKVDYAFKSRAWKINNIKREILEENCRVIISDIFFDMLLKNAAQSNKNLSDTYIEALNNTRNNNILKPTKIFCINEKADKVNEAEYQKLKQKPLFKNGDEVIYRTEFSKNSETRNWLSETGIKQSDIPDVPLIVGALVLLTYNIDIEKGMTNGARGEVVALSNKGPIVRFERKDKNGKVVEEVIEPIKIRYNINNQCQENDSCLFPASRNRTGDGLPTHCREHGKHMVTCDISVNYYPVKLGYAFTSHKIQGMTLDSVEFDIEGVFAPGQAYVAISRVRKLEDLKIIGTVAKKHFFQDESVTEFYEN